MEKYFRARPAQKERTPELQCESIFVISHLHPHSCVPQRSPPPLYSPLQLDFCLSSSLSALLQTSSTPPSWNQVQKTPQGTLIVAALGHAKIDVTLRLKVNVNFGMAKRCHSYFFHSSLKRISFQFTNTLPSIFLHCALIRLILKRVCCAIPFRCRLDFTLRFFCILFHIHNSLLLAL